MAGAGLGAVFGLLHAISLFRHRIGSGRAGPVAALYYALWTVGLWTLFGAYLLVFWILGAVGLAVSRLLRPQEAGR